MESNLSIWHRLPQLEQLNENRQNTILELLDIRFEAVDDDSLTASMVVDSRTHQPYGLLHGGASVVLAETVGSTASYQCIDPSRFYCVGLEVRQPHSSAAQRTRYCHLPPRSPRAFQPRLGYSLEWRGRQAELYLTADCRGSSSKREQPQRQTSLLDALFGRTAVGSAGQADCWKGKGARQ